MKIKKQTASGKVNKKSSASTILFGKHLTVDAYYASFEALNSFDAIFSFLTILPQKIAMHTITTPYVVRCFPNDKKDCGGLSGFVMIAESHISIHTFPEKQYFTMDVYSCTIFDHRIVMRYAKEIFRYKKCEQHILKRGLKFPLKNTVI